MKLDFSLCEWPLHHDKYFLENISVYAVNTVLVRTKNKHAFQCIIMFTVYCCVLLIIALISHRCFFYIVHTCVCNFL